MTLDMLNVMLAVSEEGMIEEMLLALSVCAASDPQAQAALDQLNALRGCEMHSTVILSAADEEMFRRLGVNLTCEPKYEGTRLFHR